MENIPRHEDEFFILLQRVGTKGKYQRYMFILFFVLWFVTAFIILSPAFLLLPNRFTCQDYPDQQQCNTFVCAQNEKIWSQYESEPLLNSLLTQFGNYHCGNESNIAMYKMVLFGGIFIGYMVFMYFSDNMGRRFGMIITSLTSTLGCLFISFGQNMTIISIGLFLMGAGCESNMRINISIMSEMVDFHLRQKYSLILQCSFGLAGVFISVAYYLLRDWRNVTHLFCTLPSILCFLIIIFYLEETPNHLLKQGSKAVLSSLQRIAKINGFEFTIKEEDVLKVIELKNQHAQAQGTVTSTFSMMDLIKFKSLKNNTYFLAGLFFFLSALYIGPSSAIDKFEINIFLLQIILSISQCIAYPIACFYIHNTKRKTIGIKCFSLCALFSFITIFISNDQDCTWCFSSIAKLILMFSSRYCVAYYYGILFIYVVEIYPEQIRTIGFGTVSAIGALGALAMQKVVHFIEVNNQNPLVYFILFSFICMYFACKLPETQGMALQVEIEQLRKPKMKQSYEPRLDDSMYYIEEQTQESESHRQVEEE